METLQKSCLVVTIIGAIVWGIIGVFDLNVLTALFGAESFIPRVIYTIVGISGIINIGILTKHFNS